MSEEQETQSSEEIEVKPTKPKSKRGRKSNAEKEKEAQELIQKQQFLAVKALVADAANIATFKLADYVAQNMGYRVPNPIDESNREVLRQSCIAAIDHILPEEATDNPLVIHAVLVGSIAFANKVPIPENESTQKPESKQSDTEARDS